MKLDEAAEYLGVSRPTLDRWIRQGLMAEAGLRGSRFDRDVLVAWSRRRGMCPTARAGGPGAAPENLLAEAVERGAVTRVEGAADAGAVIEGAVRALALAPAAHATLLEAVLERERLAATALGHGVAIPHPRQPRPDVVEAARLSVVFLDPPVDWAAIDRLPVHTAFLVLSPSTAVHLQLLSRIAYALREPGFDEFLLERPSKSELAQHLRAIHKDA